MKTALPLALIVSTYVLALSGCARPDGDAVQTDSRGLTPVPTTRVRKNVKLMTAEERQNFVEAVLQLKATPSPYNPSLSYYDQFVDWHLVLYRCDPLVPGHRMMGHGGPVFLPWHRQYLLLFESALREVSGKNITVPYWDWTDPLATASVFSADMLGGDGDPTDSYAVTTGPFRKGNWQLVVQPIGVEWQSSATSYLTRRFGSIPSAPSLPTVAEVSAALAAPLYDVAPYDTTSNPAQSFRNALEGFRDAPGFASMQCGPDGVMTTLPINSPKLHNGVHAWVGGTIGVAGDGSTIFGTMVLPTSPNDPIFFLHHSNIDRLWAQWQTLRGTHTYQPVSGHHGNNLYDPMVPYDQIGLTVTPADMADIATLGYRFE